MTTSEQAAAGERADLLAALAKGRYFLRYTVRGLTDEQTAQRTTASELCLGGLIKHVTLTERQWMSFIADGPSAMGGGAGEGDYSDWLAVFRMLPGETLAGVLGLYEQVAQRTDEFVAAAILCIRAASSHLRTSSSSPCPMVEYRVLYFNKGAFDHFVYRCEIRLSLK